MSLGPGQRLLTFNAIDSVRFVLSFRRVSCIAVQNARHCHHSLRLHRLKFPRDTLMVFWFCPKWNLVNYFSFPGIDEDKNPRKSEHCSVRTATATYDVLHFTCLYLFELQPYGLTWDTASRFISVIVPTTLIARLPQASLLNYCKSLKPDGIVSNIPHFSGLIGFRLQGRLIGFLRCFAWYIKTHTEVLALLTRSLPTRRYFFSLRLSVDRRDLNVWSSKRVTGWARAW